MWTGVEAFNQQIVETDPIIAIARCLEQEICWFGAVLDARIRSYFEHEDAPSGIYQIRAPDISGDPSPYAGLVRMHDLGFDDRIALMLTLMPHVRPQMLDTFFIRNKHFDRGFTEFGGLTGKNHGGFLPTGETLAFILSGDDLIGRSRVLSLFDDRHPFIRNNILNLTDRTPGEPFLSGALQISHEYLSLITTGGNYHPDFSAEFPARRITTSLSWSDLVLTPGIVEEIEHIYTWLRNSDTLLNAWGLNKSLKPGYRALFYGPPGTGKTLTATLLGNRIGVDVYRIDLASVVSKYIGETEKNLSKLFNQAQDKKWILFFDEADALFGKRTQTASSNDRYANQEVSYLLQRVEDFPGTVILATNLRNNIDEAFARRFQSLVFFSMPDSDQRLKLWRSILGKKCRLAADVDLPTLAEQYDLSGGAITNVVRYGAVRALRLGRNAVCTEDFIAGVTRELRKEGKTI